MKRYKVTIFNGGYPLVFECDSIAEAYGCMVEVSNRFSAIYFDRDSMMETLVEMKNGNSISFENGLYRIEATEETQ